MRGFSSTEALLRSEAALLRGCRRSDPPPGSVVAVCHGTKTEEVVARLLDGSGWWCTGSPPGGTGWEWPIHRRPIQGGCCRPLAHGLLEAEVRAVLRAGRGPSEVVACLRRLGALFEPYGPGAKRW